MPISINFSNKTEKLQRTGGNKSLETDLCLLGDLVHGVGEVADVFRGDAGNRNATVLGQVDAVLGGELLDLGRSHSREAEHADLVGDVLPVAARALLGQTIAQHGAHRDDAIGHSLHVLQPEVKKMQLSRLFQNKIHF